MTDAKATRVRLLGERSSIGEAESLLSRAGDLALVQRGELRWAVMFCPCGCGDTLRINLDGRAGPAWRVWRDARGVTIYPSVWRDAGCGSHFIVWDSRVWLSGAWDEQWNVESELEDSVLAKLGAEPRGALEIADELSEVPWRVHQALRTLERRALAVQTGARSGRWSRSR
jgi:hypothetical protein